MNWSSLSDFAAMGGYALYVWGSYGVVAAAVGWELLMLVQRHRRATSDARDWRLFEGAVDDAAP